MASRLAGLALVARAPWAAAPRAAGCIATERLASSSAAATSYPTAAHRRLLPSRPMSCAPPREPAPPPPSGRRPAEEGAAAAAPGQRTPAWYRLLRLDKPTGTLLLLSPCLWSIGLATSRSLAALGPAAAAHAPQQAGVTAALSALAGASPLSLTWHAALPPLEQSLVVAALFSFGAVCLRGAGCTVNDILDRELDAKVERTRGRPLASGEMRPAEAVAVLGATLTLGLGVLLQLNPLTQVLGCSSLLLVGAYPLMKRVTDWPQLWLGLTFNWGAIMGWSAIREGIDAPVVAPLYCAGIAWTLMYDTIYAHQDKRDDVRAGIRSTAVLLGDRYTKPALSAFSALFVASLAAAGLNNDAGAAYHAACAGAAAHLAWQISTVDLNDRRQCMSMFNSNKYVGAIVAAGVAADVVAKARAAGAMGW